MLNENTKMKNAKHFHELYMHKSIVIKTLKHTVLISILLVFLACNVSPKPIDYGNEACYYCKMTIVDKIHATEIVTKKGKIYQFDAAECMVNFFMDFDNSKVKLFLTNTYNNPETLIDATKATYLISENIPSPMGAFLTAFEIKEDAVKMKSKKGGDIYTWEELLIHFKNADK